MYFKGGGGKILTKYQHIQLRIFQLKIKISVNFHRRVITRVTFFSYRDFIVYDVNLTIFIKYRYIHFVRFLNEQ